MNEYLVNVSKNKLSFLQRAQLHLVMLLRLFMLPILLINDVGNSPVPGAPISGLSQNSYQNVYHLDVGVLKIEPQSDTLGRSWAEDRQYVN